MYTNRWIDKGEERDWQIGVVHIVLLLYTIQLHTSNYTIQLHTSNYTIQLHTSSYENATLKCPLEFVRREP